MRITQRPLIFVKRQFIVFCFTLTYHAIYVENKVELLLAQDSTKRDISYGSRRKMRRKKEFYTRQSVTKLRMRYRFVARYCYVRYIHTGCIKLPLRCSLICVLRLTDDPANPEETKKVSFGKLQKVINEAQYRDDYSALRNKIILSSQIP